ncbi:ABC transporter ATP-binding protein [Oerskovia sp. KBS0722]|uniref:ABC transporter ATP-binding protein n=1 Tax=Oerskovia sp. KBS0722 TaxID=1179673 RepID=UPI00110F0A19|nr:ATP-binding cassette domain-containing protein [Oerskovia sp. KBS0722]QDW61377.1 ATP-binding cassette domain-containing protein [Oerskovia sp. KBS0722]
MTLATSDLTFAYRRGTPPVIEGLTTAFAPGALTAVTGPSGSGKSTLLYILALMLRTTSGEVLWDGRPVASLPDAERSRLRAADVGFVFQDAMLDPARTVIDNVCEGALFAGMPARTARTRAAALLDRFGVGHRATHRPGEISGGQAQRVALCRALLTSPRVVFGDEPTGNLDHASARIVWDALRDHARDGATVVIATHDEQLAAEANHRLVLV